MLSVCVFLFGRKWIVMCVLFVCLMWVVMVLLILNLSSGLVVCVVGVIDVYVVNSSVVIWGSGWNCGECVMSGCCGEGKWVGDWLVWCVVVVIVVFVDEDFF